MRLLHLPDALRDRGVEPVLVAGWERRGVDFPSTPHLVLRHWTAGSITGRTPSLNTVTNGRSDLPGPLSQVLQSREAPGTRDKAYVIAAGKANHAGAGIWNGFSGNYDSTGLEIEWSGPGEAFSNARFEVSNLILRAMLDVSEGQDPLNACDHREYATPAGRKQDTNLSGALLRADMARLTHLNPPEDDMIRIVNLTDPDNPGAGTHTYAVSGIVGRHMKRDADIAELIKRFEAVDERPKGVTSSLMFDLANGPLKTP